jgi:flagellar P-ring protein precursor FlgI
MKKKFAIFTAVLLFCGLCDGATRIKDIVNIYGVRGNTLEGVGLVVGLNGTGDASEQAGQLLASWLRRNGDVTFEPYDLNTSSIAIVTVTAELGPWNRLGSRIDVNVSTIGEAISLQGGELLATELKGHDGQVYAVARATSISTSSWTISGNTGSSATKNHPTGGFIASGAYVEREELSDFWEFVGVHRKITLLLRNSDFTTARRIGDEINELYAGSTIVKDASTIEVRIPDDIADGREVDFLVEITAPEVEVDMAAKVIINERTGTIIVGGNVAISETAVAQGSLVVKVNEQQAVSQPGMTFGDSSLATTETIDVTSLLIDEEAGSLIPVYPVVTVTELARALNAIGATPKDLIAIFNALKVAGALQAEIEMM